ncbi:unnamed protein product [Hyaloperonospora brassicae]|uniref:ENTH domain-containing protein n=1 Tax=Hyaloperonospora brassicae TaxID=162125 RepID=A0AAV0UBK4_HYABA|nr:unnamed protein product [Hyaloperonospora brassicae]
MHRQWRPAPESTYASQAARWKQGFKAPSPRQQQQQQLQPSVDQTDLENALVSELCSSLGSSSFPPREVLQKLLRYLHTLDHDYVCELLDDKFESPVWQVKAKALSVLSALLSSTDAEFYKQYYSGRLDLVEELRRARKDMLRKRADKVYALLKDCVPTADGESVLEMMHRIRDDGARDGDARAPEMQTLMHTSPIMTSQQTPQGRRMNTNKSSHSSSAPLPSALPAAAVEEAATAFHFLAVSKHEPQAEYVPAQMAAEPLTPPASNSAFGFLSVNGGEMDSLSSTPSGSVGPKSGVVARPSSQNSDPLALAAPPNMPVPSAPPLATDSSSFGFLAQTPAANGIYARENVLPAFALMERQDQPLQQQQPRAALATAPAPTSALRHCHTVFDTLPQPTPFEPSQVVCEPEKGEVKVEESSTSDPIHDAFEGMDAHNGAQALDSLDAYTPSRDSARGENESVVPQPTQMTESLREVILEIDVPPGPMGVMLDRTIPDMTVIERFVPLPTGGRGYLELHPAICPGCALISINSIIVENKGLVEVGPILGSLTNAPKLLRFKKLMNNGRPANPSTLQMPYVPPPLEEEVHSSVAEKSAEREPGSEDTRLSGSSSGEAFMTCLNGYSSALCEIEAKLKEIIRREQAGQLIVDRRNQLAQLHGNVEKIQTEGIDSVILGDRRPLNYEEVKQFRLMLVHKANELARMIQSTAMAGPSLCTSVPASGGEKQPVSAFAFVQEEPNTTTNNDPPLGISQLQGDSGFRFLNANANAQVADVDGRNVVAPVSGPVAQPPGQSYGFSFLADNYIEQPVASDLANLTVSQAPTSPSSSFGVLSTAVTSPGAQAASNVFAGLSLKTGNQQKAGARRPAAPALCDTLTKSSHGRPMGLSDLEASLRSTASGKSCCPVPRAPESVPLPSAFAFLSTSATSHAHGPVVFDSSSTSTEATSPTGFSFLRDSTVSSNAPTVGSLHAHSTLHEPPASMFSFISSD